MKFVGNGAEVVRSSFAHRFNHSCREEMFKTCIVLFFLVLTTSVTAEESRPGQQPQIIQEPAIAKESNETTHCAPNWANESELKLDAKTAVFLTHFTERLDKNRMTRPALKRLVSAAKSKQHPTIYLHERHESNDKYFYTDCSPTAYIDSDIGFFEFDSSKIKHAVVAGGFYELCLHNTYRSC